MRFLASTDLFTNYLTYVYMYVRTYPLLSVNEAAQPTATTLFGIRSRMTSAGWDDLEKNRRGAEIVMTIITGARVQERGPDFWVWPYNIVHVNLVLFEKVPSVENR